MIEEDGSLSEELHPQFAYTFAEVKWAMEQEMAMTVEDVLSRRLRMLVQNAKASLEVAPKVAKFMADLMGNDQEWVDQQLKKFEKIALKYQIK